MTTDSQRLAWADLQDKIGDRRARVYEAIYNSEGGLTLFELVEVLGVPVNEISGRVTELHHKGMIRKAGTRINPNSGKAGTVWQIVQTRMQV